MNTFEVSEKSKWEIKKEFSGESDEGNNSTIDEGMIFSTPRTILPNNSNKEEKKENPKMKEKAMINIRSFQNVKNLNFSNLDISQQLALMDLKYWRKLDLNELVSFASQKKKGFFNSPHINNSPHVHSVHSFINHFNNLSRWVATKIVSCSFIDDRVDSLQNLIEIAFHSLKLNSFNVFVAFISTLNSHPIQRLKNTWNSVIFYSYFFFYFYFILFLYFLIFSYLFLFYFTFLFYFILFLFFVLFFIFILFIF